MIVSTELDEVMQLADRIAVLYRGRLVGIVPATTSRDVLGLMMAGVPANEAEASAAAHAHSSPTTAAVPEPAGHEGEAHV
jgi:simple sugar transport system ATP-binding protein